MRIINSAVVFFFIMCYGSIAAHAQNWREDLSFTFDFTYASKYMWHGFDVFDGNGSFQPSATVQYKNLYAGVWMAQPDSSGFEDLQELDYFIGYDRSILEDERYAVDFSLLYTYFDFPNDVSAEAQEFALGITFPNVLPIGDSYLVPGYTAFYNWEGIPSRSQADNGWFHDLSLSYEAGLPKTIFTQEEQTLVLDWSITYNDGAYGTDSGFSHTTIGVSTEWEWDGYYLSPLIAYQWSMEDSVNHEDDFYVMISTGVSF